MKAGHKLEGVALTNVQAITSNNYPDDNTLKCMFYHFRVEIQWGCSKGRSVVNGTTDGRLGHAIRYEEERDGAD
jgi:hypothetical protein